MEKISGKNIWIVGASSGIGASLAKDLASSGANIILSARRENKLKEVEKSLQGKGHMVATLDVLEEEKIEKAVKKITKKYEAVDSIIYLAADYKPHDKGEQDINKVRNIIKVNLVGAYNIVHYALPVLKNQGYGQLALCGSVAGYRGLPNGQPYCSTKAAIINLAESLYMENKNKNIDVKLISPGFVKTPLTDKNDFPMPFIIEPEEAARRIAKGLTSNSFEIHFPKRMTLILKFLQLMPNWLYLKLAKNFDR